MDDQGHSEAVTEGIRVRVRSAYVPERSSPSRHHYFFAYDSQRSEESYPRNPDFQDDLDEDPALNAAWNKALVDLGLDPTTEFEYDTSNDQDVFLIRFDWAAADNHQFWLRTNWSNNEGENPSWLSYEKLRSVIEKKMFSNTEDLLPVISLNAKASSDDQKKHDDFVARMVDRGYTEKQVRSLAEWYLRVRKSQ